MSVCTLIHVLYALCFHFIETCILNTNLLSLINPRNCITLEVIAIVKTPPPSMPMAQNEINFITFDSSSEKQWFVHCNHRYSYCTDRTETRWNPFNGLFHSHDFHISKILPSKFVWNSYNMEFSKCNNSWMDMSEHVYVYLFKSLFSIEQTVVRITLQMTITSTLIHLLIIFRLWFFNSALCSVSQLRQIRWKERKKRIERPNHLEIIHCSQIQ